MACLSSFFRFLQRMDIVLTNPCDKLERPRTSTPPARGLSADEVRRLLAVVPATPQGLRDRAIILTLVLTGRRRAEVFRMAAGDRNFENGVCFLLLPRQRREDRQARVAPTRTGRPDGSADGLREGPRGHGSLRFAVAHTGGSRREGAVERHLLQSFPPISQGSRTSARRPAPATPYCRQAAPGCWESVESVSRFLDHSSLAVTTTYLRRLEGQEDRGWGKVAEAIGVHMLSGVG